jgi:hypothetical protein
MNEFHDTLIDYMDNCGHFEKGKWVTDWVEKEDQKAKV